MTIKKSFLIFSVVLIFFSFLINCKNDIKRPPLVSLFLPLNGIGEERLGVISTDFSSGGRFSLINPSLLFSTPTFANIHSDAVMRYVNNRIYIINRLNRDSVLVLNPDLGFIPVGEFSIGRGKNPQDIIVINENKAYISLYNSNEFLVVNPIDGNVLKRLDFSIYSEESSLGVRRDLIPEMNRMELYNGNVYLQVQRLDRNDPSGFPAPNTTSYILKINTVTDQVEKVIQTPSPNPLGRMYIVSYEGSPHLFFAAPARLGFLSKMDGGIYSINLVTDEVHSVPHYLEVTAGGDILEMVIQNENSGYAYILDQYFNKMIQKFHPKTGQKLSTLATYGSSSGNFAGMALSRSGKLYTGETNFSNPGVMVYDVNGDDAKRLSIQPIDVGLRPFDMEVLE
jgi:DNA-binding beta-propeller fold protein YncE